MPLPYICVFSIRRQRRHRNFQLSIFNYKGRAKARPFSLPCTLEDVLGGSISALKVV